eukprot:Anaeramoba_ignava/a219449_53.p1 GENE.a219449_53~~a219449_53.p1  ORF type:complete len:533 (+),score=174.37 a219449_53:6-1604(+)
MTTGNIFITVIEAKNLLSADSNGKSDPYCKVFYGKKKQKTKTIKKTLDPVWNEKLKFEKMKLDSDLEFEVYDWDRFGGDDPLGKTKISVRELVESNTNQPTIEYEQWQELVPIKSGQKAQGEIHIKLSIEIKSRSDSNETNQNPQIAKPKELNFGIEVSIEEEFEPRKLFFGLAWDLLDEKGVDLDVSAVMFDQKGNIFDSVYFGNQTSKDNSLVLSGDNTTGRGEGDDETIQMILQKIDKSVVAILFVISVYSQQHTFSNVETATSHIVDSTDNKELYHFSLGCNQAQGKTVLIFGRLFRYQGLWRYSQINRFLPDKNLKEMPRGFGSVIPQLKESLLDLIPNIKIKPNEKKIMLSKGQSCEIPSDLIAMHVGLGWDPPKTSGRSVDLDASILMYDYKKDIYDTVYYANKTSKDNSIVHSGDNVTGQGQGDDEVITVNLNKIAREVKYLVVVVTSYSGHTFNTIQNSFVRILAPNSKKERIRYNLKKLGAKTALIVGLIVRENVWNFKAIGDVTDGKTAKDLTHKAKSFLN